VATAYGLHTPSRCNLAALQHVPPGLLWAEAIPAVASLDLDMAEAALRWVGSSIQWAAPAALSLVVLGVWWLATVDRLVGLRIAGGRRRAAALARSLPCAQVCACCSRNPDRPRYRTGRYGVAPPSFSSGSCSRRSP
jgi:hypothetical protein